MFGAAGRAPGLTGTLAGGVARRRCVLRRCVLLCHVGEANCVLSALCSRVPDQSGLSVWPVQVHEKKPWICIIHYMGLFFFWGAQV